MSEKITSVSDPRIEPHAKEIFGAGVVSVECETHYNTVTIECSCEVILVEDIEVFTAKTGLELCQINRDSHCIVLVFGFNLRMREE